MALGNLRSHAWAHARVGTYLRGKWLLRELIGVGGMAAVFAATDRDQNQVAIKLLNPSFARVEQLRDRFLRECYIANRVGHPGAVRVFDYDIDHASGEAFLVMELLQGETVGDLLERQGAPFAAASVVEIVLRTLSVLKAAHLQDIIHRDLKPENLFLTTDGKLRVLDFGIASLREHTGNSMMTRIGDVMGTPAYMPPEQAQGRWDQVDARSDLWALGAVAFHLLSGREVHEA
ncbi:MAG: serine/threonine protein kinase, partial [Polyangiaceae bacterium]|nr:serine/threonine protein kinase [Polyangiaceae bacterium]